MIAIRAAKVARVAAVSLFAALSPSATTTANKLTDQCPLL
jgi:hypothetical protein